MIGYNQTTKKFDSSKARYPKELGPYYSLAGIYRERSNPPKADEADRIVAKMVEVNNQSFDAHRRRAVYLLQYHNAADEKKEPAKSKAERDAIKSEVAEAMQLAPNDASVIFLRAHIARIFDKDYATAEDLLRGALARRENEQDYRLYDELKTLLLQQNNVPEALKVVEQGRKLLPNNPLLMQDLLQIQIAQNKLPEARHTLELMAKVNYPKPFLDLNEADILMHEQKWLAASQLLEKLRPGLAALDTRNSALFSPLAKQSDLIRADLAASRCYEMLGEYDKQIRVCKQILQEEPNSGAATLQLANALMDTGKNDEARGYYRTLVHAIGPEKVIEAPDIVRRFLMLLIVEQVQKPDEKKRNWNEIDQLLKISELSLLINEQTRKPAEKDRDWKTVDGWLKSTANQDALGDPNLVKLFKDRVESFKKHVDPEEAQKGSIGPAMLLLFEVEVAKLKGNIDGIDKVTKQPIVDSEGKPVPSANQLMKEVREKFPKSPLVWNTWIGFVSQQEGAAAALKVLESLPPEIQKDVSNRLLHAQLLVAVGGDNVQKQLAELDRGSADLNPADQARLWQGLGAAFIGLGNAKEAQELWLKVADGNPENVKICFSLVDLVRESGDLNVMSHVLELQRQRLGPNSPEARCVEAALTVAKMEKKIRDGMQPGQAPAPLGREDKLTLDKARKLLDEVNQARPDWYIVSRTRGDLEGLDGNIDLAITDYKRALEVGPPSPTTIQSLVDLLQRRNRFDEVPKYTAMLPPGAVHVMRLAPAEVEAKMREGKYAEALTEARQVVPDESTEPYKLLWLASLYTRADRPAEKGATGEKDRPSDRSMAEAALRRAVKAGPQIPETWLSLVECLAKQRDLNGQPDPKKIKEASDLLTKARKELPEDQVNNVLAKGYEMIGADLEAEQYYQAALEAAPDDLSSHRSLATFYLRLNLERDPARRKQIFHEINFVLDAAEKDAIKQQSNLMWARRMKAELLFETDRYQDFLAGKALLLENIKLSPDGKFDPDGKLDPTDDRLLLAYHLAARQDEPGAWREAIDRYAAIKTPLPLDQQLLVARRRDDAGDWKGSLEDMKKLANSGKKSPAVLRTYIDLLLRHDMILDASAQLDQLEDLDQREAADGGKLPLDDVFLRAHLLVKQNRTAEAIAALRAAQPSHPIDAKDIPKLRMIAFALDRLGLNSTAEEMYRDYADQPEADLSAASRQLLLAGFLGRTGKVDEALEACQKAMKDKSVKPAELLQVVCGILRSQPNLVKPEHFAKVEVWFKDAQEADLDSLPIKLHYAEFREIANRWGEAEKMYRDILRDSGSDPMLRGASLNNVAFILAEQKKDLAEALEFVNEAVHVFGPKSDVLDTRGVVYIMMGNYPEAVHDLTVAMSVAEPAPIKLLHLAMAQDLAGDKQGARATLKRSKERKLDSKMLGTLEREFYDKLQTDLGP